MVDLPPISEDEHKRWFTPVEALIALKPLSADAAGVLLQEAARSEEVRTSAKSFYCEPKNLPGFSMSGYAQIPAYYWAHLSGQHSKSSDFWQTGSLRTWFGTSPYFRMPTAVRCMDVRFNREDVEKVKPPVPRQLLAEALKASSPLPSPAIVKHPGGKPPKGIWEGVWVEIAARLYNGTLIPTKQADIEAAIMEISALLGDGVEIAAARRHAKPLWNKIKPEDHN